MYNECDNLDVLCARLNAALTALAGQSWEIVLVDDGSKDGSWEIIERLHAADPRVVGLRFSRNFGHHIALAAGIDAARGNRVVTMDSDLQDQPEEIATLAAKMDEGYDLVYATRMGRKHNFLKRFSSSGFLWILNKLSDVPEPITGAVFRIMNRPFVDELTRLRERHRLFTGMTAWLGFRQTTVEVVHAERYAGKTKYGIRKMLRLSVDSVTAFSAKPLFLMMYIGMVISLSAVGLGGYIVIRHILGGFSIVGWASIMAATSFFSGIILMALGIVGQYVGRIYEEQKGRPMYVLQEKLQGAVTTSGLATSELATSEPIETAPTVSGAPMVPTC